MEDSSQMDSDHLSSAAAFVEGGIQDACEDSCSICLEAFCDSDPSTVTMCKHEYHLQCILEWCQRSSQCPMCWQPISLKDPTSQELLDAVEWERNIRSNQRQKATIIHHPTLGEFELQHLPVGASDEELEERIIQHLAAAAAMGRVRHFGRREGLRVRSGSHGCPQVLVFSTHPNGPTVGSVSETSAQREENELDPADVTASPAVLPSPGNPPLQIPSLTSAADDHVSMLSTRRMSTTTRAGLFTSGGSSGHFTSDNQDRAGPSDLQSFSESLKSRLNAVSMRYKDSIAKSTRGWKEKLFSRNSTVADFGSEVRREVNAGIATVSRMMERLEARDNRRASVAFTLSSEHSFVEPTGDDGAESNANGIPESNNVSASCTAISRG